MNIKEWILDNKGKFIALSIGFVYILIALFFGDKGDPLLVVLFLIIPLFLIFFGDSLGGYTGPVFGIKPYITKTTPGCFIAFIGWILLLFPIILAIVKPLGLFD